MLATIVNSVAAVVFIVVAFDQIDWLVVLLIAIGSTILSVGLGVGEVEGGGGGGPSRFGHYRRDWLDEGDRADRRA